MTPDRPDQYEFMRGYLIACATIQRYHDVGSPVTEALSAAGVRSVDDLRSYDLDDMDVTALAGVLP